MERASERKEVTERDLRDGWCDTQKKRRGRKEMEKTHKDDATGPVNDEMNWAQ